MLSTFLVPLDGSSLAERALPYAVALARAVGGRVVLVRVPTVEGLSDPLEARSDPAAELDAVVEQVRAEGVEAEPVLSSASSLRDVPGVILQVARERRADIIVMSTHGRGGLGRWLYGSVADQVLRQSDRPVLLISAACDHLWPRDRAPRLLVPLDGSPLAEAALGPALDLARALGAELALLSVVDPRPFGAVGPIDLEPELAQARRYLDQVVVRVRSAVPKVAVYVEIGLPAPTITALAEQEGMDAIVMATHGRGGLARLVLGSVATATLQRSRVPLVLTRPVAMRQRSAGVGAGAEVSPRTPLTLTLNARELDLVERGLRELVYVPGHPPELSEPARSLLARLQELEARATSGEAAGEPASATHG